jgi:hypothetical protein
MYDERYKGFAPLPLPPQKNLGLPILKGSLKIPDISKTKKVWARPEEAIRLKKNC